MSNVRYIERQTLDIRKLLTTSRDAEGFTNGLGSLGSCISFIHSTESNISDQLRLLDIEIGAGEIEKHYHEFATVVDNLIAGVRLQSGQTTKVLDLSEEIKQVIQKVDTVQSSIHCHLSQLENVS